MKYPPFFSDLTNKVFTYLIEACMLFMIGTYLYFILVKDVDYEKLKEPRHVDAYNIEKLDLSSSIYCTLTNFCIDDESYSYQKDHTIEAYYFFLNRHCDSTAGPVIIMEMEPDIYNRFSIYSDSLSNELLAGRLYKGYECSEAPFHYFDDKIGDEQIYTFRAGHTPPYVKAANNKLLLFIVGGTFIIILSFIFTLIMHNRKRKKEFYKKLMNMNNPSQPIPPPATGPWLGDGKS